MSHRIIKSQNYYGWKGCPRSLSPTINLTLLLLLCAWQWAEKCNRIFSKRVRNERPYTGQTGMAAATAFLHIEIHVQRVAPGSRRGFGMLELQHRGFPLLHTETALGALLRYIEPQ